MSISPEFKSAIDTKDVRLTRIMLKDSMVIDPTFGEFDALLKYAEKGLPNLYDKHDGEIFSNDISTWNKDLLNEQMVNVVYNFSKERVAFLKKLCRYIYADRIDAKERDVFVSEHHPIITKKQIGTGMVAGGAIAAIVGAVTSHPVVIIAGAAVAVAGGIVYYQNR